MSEPFAGGAESLSALRRMLRLILVLAMLGTCAELLLLGHTEDWRQWIPLALTALGVGVLAWHCARPGPRSTRAVRATMMAFIAAGFAGCYYHFQGSAEFKLESNPSLAGWALFWAAVRSKNPPSLAPGVMIQIGLLGLAFCYRRPALAGSKKMPNINSGERE